MRVTYEVRLDERMRAIHRALPILNKKEFVDLTREERTRVRALAVGALFREETECYSEKESEDRFLALIRGAVTKRITK